MTERDDRDALFQELWPVREPSPDFAERVLEAAGHDPAQPAMPPTPPPPPGRPASSSRRAGRRPWVWATGAGVLAVAATLLIVDRLLEHPAARRGHVVAEARTTVPLASGTLAVVEPGTEMAWSRTGKSLRVDQGAGSIFFRVDRGSDFRVFTPVGQVEVTGTCFRVSVEPAGSDVGRPTGRAGAGKGPEAPEIVALVEVMEGSVRVQNSHGEAILTAGERGRMQLGAPPTRLLDVGGPRIPAGGASALPRFSADATARPPGDRGEPGARQRWSEAEGVPTEKYFDFTPEQRRVLARRCLFKWGMPRHLTDFVDPSFPDIVFDAPTRAEVARVIEQHREHFIAELRAIYAEVVGEEQAAANLSAMSLFTEIDTKSPRAEGREARQLILSEWAGDVAPPPAGMVRPPLERFWRLMVGAQDEIVRRLEGVVGPTDARRIGRRILNHRMVGKESGCPSGAGPAR